MLGSTQPALPEQTPRESCFVDRDRWASETPVPPSPDSGGKNKSRRKGRGREGRSHWLDRLPDQFERQRPEEGREKGVLQDDSREH